MKLFRLTALAVCICLLVISLCACVESPAYYEITEDDKIPSLTTVVGDRDVKANQIGKQYVKYVYKNLTDAAADVEEYVDYLRDEGFRSQSTLIYPKKGTTIILAKALDVNSKHTLTVTITYDETEIRIEAERETSVE